VTDLSSSEAEVTGPADFLDSPNGKASVEAFPELGTSVATTLNEADETSPEKSRGEKSGPHVD
jgi:hypothetical protein